MIKKRIKYTDLNGIEREEDFYFHFSKSELFMMEGTEEGGLVNRLESIVAKKDGVKIMQFYHDFILRAYGEKSDDGIYFNKSPEIAKKFEAHPAFDVLFTELMENPEEALKFVNAVFPVEAKLKVSEGAKG